MRFTDRRAAATLMGFSASLLAAGEAHAHGWKHQVVGYAPATVGYAPVAAAPAVGYAPVTTAYAPAATAYAPAVGYVGLAPQPVSYYPAAAAAPAPAVFGYAPQPAAAAPPAAAPPALRAYVVHGYTAYLTDEEAAKLGLNSPAGAAGSPAASPPSPALGAAPPAAEPGSLLSSEADLQAVQDAIRARADELRRAGTTGFGDLIPALYADAERAYAERANRPTSDLTDADRKTINTLTARALGFTGGGASGQTVPAKPAAATPAQPAAATAQPASVLYLAPAAYVPVVPVQLRTKHGLFHHNGW